MSSKEALKCAGKVIGITLGTIVLILITLWMFYTNFNMGLIFALILIGVGVVKTVLSISKTKYSKRDEILSKARLYEKRDDLKTANQYYQELLELDSKDIEVLQKVAYNKEQLGKKTEALRVYNKIYRLDPKNKFAKAGKKRLAKRKK